MYKCINKFVLWNTDKCTSKCYLKWISSATSDITLTVISKESSGASLYRSFRCNLRYSLSLIVKCTHKCNVKWNVECILFVTFLFIFNCSFQLIITCTFFYVLMSAATTPTTGAALVQSLVHFNCNFQIHLLLHLYVD